MHKIIYFFQRKNGVPTLPKMVQTHYPKHTYFFIWPNLFWLFNPLYSGGLSHTDKYNMDGIVHYNFKGVPARNSKLLYT